MIKLVVGTYTVYLRNAEFGDVWTIDTNIVLAKTMAGYTKHYKGSRPTFQKVTITSRLNKADDYSGFMNMLADYGAQQIALSTYYGNVIQETIYGFITNPIIEAVTELDTCGYSLSFEFLYAKVPGTGGSEVKVDDTPVYLYPTDCPT